MNENTLSPFKRALLEAQLEQWRDLPAEKDIDLQPSKEFDEKSRKLIEDAKRGNVGKMSTALRRIILVAAIIASLAGTALAIPAVREGIIHSWESSIPVPKDPIRFFVSNAGTHFDFQFDQKQAASAPDKIEKVYKPTYIPKKFVQTQKLIGYGVVCYIWESGSKEYITFDQIPIPNNCEGFSPTSENVETAYLDWKGFQIFCVYDDSVRMYFWTDDEYFYGLCFHTDMSIEEQYKVFLSITVDKNAEIPYRG